MPIDSFAPQPPIVFEGVEIRGVVERFPVPPPELQAYRVHFSGVHGEHELRGGKGGRTLEIQIVLADQWLSKLQLVEFYNQTLNRDLINTNGTLTYRYAEAEGGENVQEFDDCTFQGFFEDPRQGPLLDVSGTMDGGWWVRGVLVFRQNSVQ
jgi:hypothetical protein